MPRQARIDAPTALHHIMARGIERGKIFRDDTDLEEFLCRLGRVISQTKTKCYAWALIPNHFHLLLKCGAVPIATVMQRLLTGYAAYYNRRHHRSGYVFQNRYKSVLCQEDVYLKELVRYIHLNPLRAGLVKDLKMLDRYPYSGHSVLMGKEQKDWQSTEAVLSVFDDQVQTGRQRYRIYVNEGIRKGRQPGLVGGGLIRSAGGWTAVRMLRKAEKFQKSDERILGDGDFVERVLAEADEQMARRYALKAKGISLDKLAGGVAALCLIGPEDLVGPSKIRKLAKGRSLFCYWAVRVLGFSMIEISKRLEISLPTVSVSVQKGEKLVRDEGWIIEKILNINI